MTINKEDSRVIAGKHQQGAKMTKVTINNKGFDFDEVVNMMDDELREEIHSSNVQHTEQSFVDAYVVAHAAKFDGEAFTLA